MPVHPLLREPWAITADGMALAISIGSRGTIFNEIRDAALAARNGKPLDNTRSVEKFGAVASIPIRGSLFRHADLLSEISGGVSYAQLRKDLQVALDDDSVEAIALDIDSPGGEVNGLAELASAIYDARSVKPIVAYVGGQGCSAAYWIACAAQKIICAETAQLGSIGVVTTFVDDTKAQEAKGEKEITIRSSGAPDKVADPTTEAGRDLIQDRLDAIEQVFFGAVAKYRGVSTDVVAKKFGRGGVRIGAEAIALGMADSLGSFESVIAELSQRGDAAQTKRTFMAKEDELAVFERDVLVALGVKDRAAAMGAIGALKTLQVDAESAKKELAALKQSTVDAECKRALDEATAAGKLAPAKRSDVESMYSKYGLDAVKSMLSMLPVVVQSASEAPRPSIAAPVGGEELSAQEIAIAKNVCGSPAELEQHLKNLREYKRARANSGR